MDAGGEEAGAEAWTLESRSKERRGGRTLIRKYVNIVQAKERDYVNKDVVTKSTEQFLRCCKLYRTLMPHNHSCLPILSSGLPVNFPEVSPTLNSF